LGSEESLMMLSFAVAGTDNAIAAHKAPRGAMFMVYPIEAKPI
jgi:hypothetical protein